MYTYSMKYKVQDVRYKKSSIVVRRSPLLIEAYTDVFMFPLMYNTVFFSLFANLGANVLYKIELPCVSDACTIFKISN